MDKRCAPVPVAMATYYPPSFHVPTVFGSLSFNCSASLYLLFPVSRLCCRAVAPQRPAAVVGQSEERQHHLSEAGHGLSLLRERQVWEDDVFRLLTEAVLNVSFITSSTPPSHYTLTFGVEPQ